jgi:hypothetical protein
VIAVFLLPAKSPVEPASSVVGDPAPSQASQLPQMIYVLLKT